MRTLPGWMWLISAAIFGTVWGLLERQTRALAQGRYSKSLGWERHNLIVRVAQGLVTLLLFGAVIICFVFLGWKMAAAFLIVSLVTASLLY